MRVRHDEGMEHVRTKRDHPSEKYARQNKGLEQYHHEWRQPGDKIARQNKELERFQRCRFIPVRLKTL